MCPLVLMAAAPANNSALTALVTDTVTTQHTATWQIIDSLVVVKSDTCDYVYTATGTVTLVKGKKLFIGLRIGSDSDQTDSQGVNISYTALQNVYELPVGSRRPKTYNYVITKVDSLLSQTDITDTVYVYAAVKGSTTQEQLVLTDNRLTATIIDKD
ncbi:MAG: hypothetical protein KAV87_06930 [Desulfobacteraceae bacterium]|nr:hypothetical protein [Desulfobacteraceae bacterium]